MLEERIWRWSQDRELVWRKPNCVPESVRDRPTRCHEYLFLLSRSPRYYFDAESIREPAVHCAAGARQSRARTNRSCSGARTVGIGANARPAKAVPNIRSSRKVLRSGTDSRHRSAIEGGQSLQAEPNGWRNKRSVWSVATVPYRGAHFATFPKKLVEPCILAGSRRGDTVLDPFAGRGTTRQVAIALNRHYVGCELNPDYVALDRPESSSVHQ